MSRELPHSRLDLNVFVDNILFQFVTFQVDGFSYNWILVGRFLNGIGCGIAMTISPIFLTELAPMYLRGAFGTSYSLL